MDPPKDAEKVQLITVSGRFGFSVFGVAIAMDPQKH